MHQELLHIYHLFLYEDSLLIKMLANRLIADKPTIGCHIRQTQATGG
jgi:hypothetical protein